MTTDVGEDEERGGVTVYTVGHSNRDLDEFVGLLKAHGVETLVDIRNLPGSNKYPRFNRDELTDSLARAGFIVMAVHYYRAAAVDPRAAVVVSR